MVAERLLGREVEFHQAGSLGMAILDGIVARVEMGSNSTHNKNTSGSIPKKTSTNNALALVRSLPRYFKRFCMDFRSSLSKSRARLNKAIEEESSGTSLSSNRAQ